MTINRIGKVHYSGPNFQVRKLQKQKAGSLFVLFCKFFAIEANIQINKHKDDILPEQHKNYQRNLPTIKNLSLIHHLLHYFTELCLNSISNGETQFFSTHKCHIYCTRYRTCDREILVQWSHIYDTCGSSSETY